MLLLPELYTMKSPVRNHHTISEAISLHGHTTTHWRQKDPRPSRFLDYLQEWGPGHKRNIIGRSRICRKAARILCLTQVGKVCYTWAEHYPEDLLLRI